ncbi:MAG: hypothetical protein RLP02_24330 [Coleofasciculus sp. C2-GNP5-27]
MQNKSRKGRPDRTFPPYPLTSSHSQEDGEASLPSLPLFISTT